MKYVLLCLLCLSSWLQITYAETIPVENFFQHAKITNMKLSPDGKHLAFSYEHETEVRLAVMELASREIKSSFHFGENMHVFNFHWPNNERVLMEVTRRTGNLDTMRGSGRELYAANIDGKRRIQLFRTERSTYQILSMLPEQKNRILIGKFHALEGSGMRPHTLDINRVRERFVDDQPTGVVNNLITDNTGEIRMGIEFVEGETMDDHQFLIHYKEGDDWQQLSLNSKRNNPTIRPVGFSADNKMAYFLSNFDMSENDTLGMYRYEMQTKKLEFLTRHSAADISQVLRGHDGHPIAIVYDVIGLRYEFIDQEHEDSLVLSGLINAFGEQRVNLTSFSSDGRLASFIVSSDRNPGDFYLLDKDNGQAEYLGSRMEGFSPEHLSPMSAISFEARDGVTIHGFLTLPKDQDKNLPLIVNVHGGPFGVYDAWGFNAEAQFFASRGYATLQVNFRGSGGYGQGFERLGRLEWGKAMQDDITDATHWAIEQGYADANRVCIYGGSYGGYAALWGVIKEPDLYRCSVGYVGVYDMPMFFSGDGSDASRNPSIGDYLTTHVGSGEEYLQSISPVHNVDKIKAALFIVHGSNDVRVPIVHANNLRAALDAIDKPYRWMVREDGHGFYKVEYRVELYTEMLDFFEEHIGKPSAQLNE